MIVDSHCHIYDKKLTDVKQDILKNIEATKQICVCNADSLYTSKLCIDLANTNKNVYATVGVHPHEVENLPEDYLINLEVLAKQNKKVVAIGEIGLDYYYDQDFKDEQIKRLKEQIVLADKIGLPCVFHIREAMGDFLSIIKEMAQYFKNSGAIHSFSGSLETAKILIKQGFYLGVNGIITFNNSQKIKEVVKETPLENLLIETDCPYLTPVPYRGQVNRPEYVNLVANKIAEIKGLTVEEVEEITAKNAIKLFKIKL